MLATGYEHERLRLIGDFEKPPGQAYRNDGVFVSVHDEDRNNARRRSRGPSETDRTSTNSPERSHNAPRRLPPPTHRANRARERQLHASRTCGHARAISRFKRIIRLRKDQAMRQVTPTLRLQRASCDQDEKVVPWITCLHTDSQTMS